MKEAEVGRRRGTGTDKEFSGWPKEFSHDLEDAVWLTFSLPDDSSSRPRNGLVKLSWEDRERQRVMGMSHPLGPLVLTAV